MKNFIKKNIKKVILFSIFALFLVWIINYYVKSSTENLIFDDINKIEKQDVAIIFGAGINGNKPSKYLKDRLDTGILLFKHQKVNKLLLSGDNGRDEYDELTVMKNYCYENGVDTTKIFIDYAGFDSYSTMYRAAAIFKIKSAILVSQKYHLHRAVFVGNQLGVKSKGFSATKGNYLGYQYACFREYFSTCKAVLDVARNRKPKFLGQTVNINGTSNYTKNETDDFKK